MTSCNSVQRPALALVSEIRHPQASQKKRLKKRDLKLIVNHDFSSIRISDAQTLASGIEREFNRLTGNCSFSRWAGVRLDYDPDTLVLDTALAILAGKGYDVKVSRQEALHEFEDDALIVFLENRPH